MFKHNLYGLLKQEPSHEELIKGFEEAIDIICCMEMEFREMKKELEFYYQAYDELTTELGEYR